MILQNLKHTLISSAYNEMENPATANIYMISTTLFMMLTVRRIVRRDELWHDSLSYSFLKDGSSVSCAIKEALKSFSFVFGKLEQLLLWWPRRYFQVTSLGYWNTP